MNQPFAPPTPPPGVRIRKVRQAPPSVRRRALEEDFRLNADRFRAGLRHVELPQDDGLNGIRTFITAVGFALLAVGIVAVLS